MTVTDIVNQLNSALPGSALIMPDGTVNVVGHITDPNALMTVMNSTTPTQYLQMYIPTDVYDYTNKRYYNQAEINANAATTMANNTTANAATNMATGNAANTAPSTGLFSNPLVLVGLAVGAFLLFKD